MSYGLRVVAAAIALIVGVVLVAVLFDRIWIRVGLGAALLVVFGGLILVAWLVDRRDKRARGDLEDI
jgi:Flp pilus assembly protein TadB